MPANPAYLNPKIIEPWNKKLTADLKRSPMTLIHLILSFEFTPIYIKFELCTLQYLPISLFDLSIMTNQYDSDSPIAPSENIKADYKPSSLMRLNKKLLTPRKMPADKLGKIRNFLGFSFGSKSSDYSL